MPRKERSNDGQGNEYLTGLDRSCGVGSALVSPELPWCVRAPARLTTGRIFVFSDWSANLIRYRDEVFEESGFGAFAEYVCVPENVALVPKPGAC